MFDRAKFWRYTRYTVLTVALLAAGFTLYLDFRVRSEFEGRRFALPARIYARPLELHAGLRIAQIDVVRELQEAGYGQGPREGDPGWFANDNDWLEVAVRPFVVWDGLQPAKGGTCRSRAWSLWPSAESIPRTTRTACWCGSPRCQSTWCKRWSRTRTAISTRTTASTCAASRARRSRSSA